MTPTEYNGRVDNAILATKLDHVISLLESEKRGAEQREHRIAALERCEAVNETRWQNHGELHTRERGLLGIGSFIGTLIAGAIGVFVDKP